MANLELIRASNGSGEATRAIVTQLRSPQSSSLTVDSVANWPQEFIATSGDLMPDGSLDPTTATVFKGHISANKIEIDSFMAGYSDIGNSVGDSVILKPTTAWANELADFLDYSHKQDGSVKQVNPNDPGLRFSAAQTQPATDPNHVIVWFQPL